MNDLKLIFFDFDGVFVDTLHICYSISKEANPEMTLEEYINCFTGNIHDAILKTGKPKNTNPFTDQRFKEFINKTESFAGMFDIAKDLSNKYKLVIVSSTPTKNIEDLLIKEKALDYFNKVMGSDVHRSKVHKINMALKEYNLHPDDTLFVTDTLGDIKEAHECKVKAIAVTWGFHDRSILEEGNPYKIVETPKELLEEILKD